MQPHLPPSRLNYLKKFDLNPDHALSYYLDSYELMQYLKISSRTLQHWRSKGLLPYSKVAGKIYYNLYDVVNLLETHRQLMST